jgi:hypothetical protein
MTAIKKFWVFTFSCFACLSVAGMVAGQEKKSISSSENATAKGEWVSLFNGKDLTGWTPKIRGHKLGDNFANTFRVEDGLLKVRYEGYEQFEDRFGHLFYEKEYSNYRLRIEYRFVGEQVPGGPGWAYRNSGVMIHGQKPETMTLDQDFPSSIEVQLLGGDGKNPRTTLNLCTPGTHVEISGKLFTPHCTSSNSKTYHGDQWVTAEIEVVGNEVIRHIIDGQVVLEYQRPQLDPNDANTKHLLAETRNEQAPKTQEQRLMLDHGSLSLQSESHPIDFRKVEIMVRSTKETE